MTNYDKLASMSRRITELETGDKLVITLIEQYGGIDGGHHKQWLIDQIARTLLGVRYETWVANYEDGEDGPETYSWDTGIAP